MIRHEGKGPIRIEPQDKPVFVCGCACGCGLSQNLPFCDGSHSVCTREEPGKVYVYDSTRTEVVEEKEDTQV